MNRLPVVNLVESGGADLPTQADLFVPAGQIFHDLTELSAMGIPTIALVFGNSTAGGAYVPGMCDYAVLVDQRAKVFLGGPPLVKMATGEESDDEELGGAAMHSRVSGLSRLLRRRRASTASASAARSSRDLNWRKLGPRPSAGATSRSTTPTSCSASRRSTSGCRSTRARSSPGSSTAPASTSTSRSTAPASSPAGRRSTATPSASSPTPAACCSWRRRRRRPSSSCSPTRPTRRWCSSRTPPATWSGKDYEQAGIIKDGAKMINAVTNSAVPHLTVIMGASYGAGNYGMCGRAYGPRFLFAWPNAKMAVMGPQQLAGVLSIVARQSAESRRPRVRRGGRRRRSARRVEDQIERESHAFFNSGKVYDDGVIDPRDTRTVLGIALSAVHSNVVRGPPRLRRLPDVAMAGDAIHKLLIANRGEIARACHPHGARRWASPPSRCSPTPTPTLPFVRDADEAVRLPGARRPRPTSRCDLIVDAARAHRRRRRAPRLRLPVRERGLRRAPAPTPGLTFVGPPPAAIEPMGSKLEAKRDHGRGRRAGAARGRRSSPATTPPLDAAAAEIGFPVLVKASFGGGGRGHARRARRRPSSSTRSRRPPARGAAAFGDGTVFLERYVEAPRHIEVQIFGDAHGTVVHAVRARVLDPAPPPEDHRGGAVAGGRRRRCGPTLCARPRSPPRGDRLRGRRHRSSSCSTPTASSSSSRSTPASRSSTRSPRWSPASTSSACSSRVAAGRAAAAGGRSPRRSRPRDRGPALRRGRRRRVPARERATRTASRFPRADGVRVDAGYDDGSVVEPALRRDAGQGHRVRAHAASAAAAARRARAPRAELHGVATNRDLLVGVLRAPRVRGRRIDTGFLDRHDAVELLVAPVRGPRGRGRGRGRARAARRATPESPLPVGIPQGWRNVGPVRPTGRARARRPPVVVELAGDGRAPGAHVDGEPESVTVFAIAGDEVDLEVRGVRRRVAVHLTDPTVYVDSDGTSLSYEVEDRFPLPEIAVAAGLARRADARRRGPGRGRGRCPRRRRHGAGDPRGDEDGARDPRSGVRDGARGAGRGRRPGRHGRRARGHRGRRRGIGPGRVSERSERPLRASTGRSRG